MIPSTAPALRPRLSSPGVSRMRKRPLLFGLLAATSVLALVGFLSAAGPFVPAEPVVSAEHARNMARGAELFRTSVRPLLIERCVKCHGGEKTRAGLDMTT